MTTTPASTTPRVSSTLGVRIRSLAGWADQIDTAQLLHVTAVTVAAAVAALAMLDATRSLYTFAVRHQSGPMGAVMLTAAVLGLYTSSPPARGGPACTVGRCPACPGWSGGSPSGSAWPPQPPQPTPTAGSRAASTPRRWRPSPRSPGWHCTPGSRDPYPVQRARCAVHNPTVNPVRQPPAPAPRRGQCPNS